MFFYTRFKRHLYICQSSSNGHCLLCRSLSDCRLPRSDTPRQCNHFTRDFEQIYQVPFCPFVLRFNKIQPKRCVPTETEIHFLHSQNENIDIFQLTRRRFHLRSAAYLRYASKKMKKQHSQMENSGVLTQQILLCLI